MFNGFDLSTVSAVYKGAQAISEIYKGSTKIWPVHDYSQDYLTIVSTSNNNTIGWKIDSDTDATSLRTISVSTDNGTTWTSYTSSITGTTLTTLNNGDKLLIKGTNTAYGASSNSKCNYFISSDTFKVEGNIMSLIYGDNFTGQTTLSADYTFKRLFYQVSGLTNDENLVLPATALTYYCYQEMFRGCSSLTTAPELPATTLVDNCYREMFYSCTALITAPELPATTLANRCYGDMFNTCTSLTTAPELPATTLVDNCYYNMFRGCTALTTAPELPATTLVKSCYYYMFRNCPSLTYIKCLATNISASSCVSNWVSGVSASGTFVKNANTTWPTGASGIPSGWTIQNA